MPPSCSWCLHYALDTSLVPPLLVAPFCSWYFLGASFMGASIMRLVLPWCLLYALGASIMLLVPLLVHAPSLMFLTPSQCSWYSRIFLDLPLRFGSPFSFRTPPPPPSPPSSTHVLGIPVCSSTSRYDFGLPSVLEEKRKKQTPPPPRPTHNHYINSYITEPNKFLQHFCTNNNG